ncbi:unnamed protein product [Orchesella dallaii]|uniref:AB hydrolase-1 domain-containing protein n=1 Tax=Orchesella dallaii TaxID=48710 RepID=A0ABP1PPY5_9HEXA
MAAQVAAGETKSAPSVPPEVKDIWELGADLKEDEDNSPWGWIRWCHTSKAALRKAEENLLSFVKAPMEFGSINVGNFDSSPEEPVKVWTAVINKECSGTPLVLIHGFASGLGLWALNYDGLAESKRPIYAFDMPGFGQSSRPTFNSDPSIAEEQFVMYMEAWRSKLGLEKMIILGHSMGAFLVFSYALKYPHRVAHMILADPWGFSEKPRDLSELAHIPTTHRVIVKVLDSLPLNPLWTVRLMGPMGAELIKRVRMDLISNFVHILKDAPSKVANYIFHCNVQKPPTGETAYHSMMSTFGWAKNPLCRRLTLLDPEIPMTLMYGSRSWVDHYAGEKIQASRPSSYVKYHVIVAGHHIYADTVNAFNSIVLDACEIEQKEQEVVKLK